MFAGAGARHHPMAQVRQISDLSSTYVQEISPQIRVSFCDMKLRTLYLAVSFCFRKIGGYSYMITVRKFPLFPIYPAERHSLCLGEVAWHASFPVPSRG